MYALAKQRNICLEKMVYKLGIVVLLMAFFSGGGMQLNAGESVVEYYIHENIMKKEHLNALFLLRQEWMESLKVKYQKNEIKEITDGIVYVRLNKIINKRKIKINVAEINRNINPNIEIIPQMASEKMHSRKRINNIAADAKIAINGTYFKQDTGTPLGVLMINNKIITGPIYDRVALGISDFGFKTSRVSFEGYIKKGDNIIALNNINQPRMMFTQVLVYTPLWGIKSPATKKESVHIAVSNNIITQVSKYPVNIPKDGYVISAPKDKVIGLKKGDKIDLQYKINPNWDDVKHIISGGPYLIKNGSVFVDAASQKLNGITGRNPRTAIGYTKDNIMIMVTVDGRKEGSSGVTLIELGRLMKELGCYEAINLDGGSSTVMYVDGTILSGTNIKNSSSISNALAVKVHS